MWAYHYSMVFDQPPVASSVIGQTPDDLNATIGHLINNHDIQYFASRSSKAFHHRHVGRSPRLGKVLIADYRRVSRSRDCVQRQQLHPTKDLCLVMNLGLVTASNIAHVLHNIPGTGSYDHASIELISAQPGVRMTVRIPDWEPLLCFCAWSGCFDGDSGMSKKDVLEFPFPERAISRLGGGWWWLVVVGGGDPP